MLPLEPAPLLLAFEAPLEREAFGFEAFFVALVAALGLAAFDLADFGLADFGFDFASDDFACDGFELDAGFARFDAERFFVWV
jgi:hypothetical protein